MLAAWRICTPILWKLNKKLSRKRIDYAQKEQRAPWIWISNTKANHLVSALSSRSILCLIGTSILHSKSYKYGWKFSGWKNVYEYDWRYQKVFLGIEPSLTKSRTSFEFPFLELSLYAQSQEKFLKYFQAFSRIFPVRVFYCCGSVNQKRCKYRTACAFPDKLLFIMKNFISSSAIFEEKEQKLLHHIVAADKHYQWTIGPYDAVIVEISNSEFAGSWKSGKFVICFDNVFAFVRAKQFCTKRKYCRSCKNAVWNYKFSFIKF